MDWICGGLSQDNAGPLNEIEILWVNIWVGLVPKIKILADKGYNTNDFDFLSGYRIGCAELVCIVGYGVPTFSKLV